MIHGLRPFRIWLRICQDKCFESRQKIKSRIPPTFFWLMLRYGTRIFPCETVLRDIPFLKKFVNSGCFSGVNDPAEIRILSIFSANIRPYAKRLYPVNQGPRWGWIGCAVRFRLKRNDAKIKQNLFRFKAKKIRFFACFASKRNWKAGNQKRNESERCENIIGKRKGNQKIA
jgi:hypothetical protein